MYSPSFEFLKSPIENVVNLLGGVPQDHEKALKHGFYNALALFLLLVALAAGWAVYIVLEPFFKPLMWALLCGSVLYPIKYSLAKSMQGWLDGLSTNSTPLLLGIVIIPIQLLDEASQRIGDVAMRYLKYIIGIVLCTMILHTIYQYTPHFCICIIWQLGIYGNAFISWSLKLFGTYVILAVILGYSAIVTWLWTPNASGHFMKAAFAVWLMISLALANLASSFQVTVFFTLQLFCIVGFLYEVWLVYKNVLLTGKNITYFDTLSRVINGNYKEDFHAKEALSEADGTNGADEIGEAQPATKHVSGYTAQSGDRVANMKHLSKPESREAVDSNQTPNTLHRSAKQDTSRPTEHSLKRELDISLERELRKRPARLHDRVTSASGGFFPHRSTSLPDTSFQKQVIAALQRHKSRVHAAGRAVRPADGERSESTRYLYGLLWACVMLSMWTYTWLMHATYILLLIYIIKYLGQYFLLWQLIGDQFQKVLNTCSNWFSSRKEALFPLPVTGIFKLMLCLNDMTLEMLKSSVNMACCTVVILGVNIAIISTVVFLTVQVYSEGIHLLQVGSNVLNNTYIKNTKMMEVFLASGWQTQIDSIMNDAYAYGRQGISTGVQHWLKGVDPEKAAQLEKQVLELWDRVYQAWMTSGTADIGPKVTSSAILASWDSIVEGVQKTPELFNTAGIVAFLQENVGTLLTVFDSVWLIFKGNITLAMDSFTAIVMILFGSGSAVINFFVNLIVFFTALFYLLASSQDMYKPVDLITKFSPNSGNRFAVALEDAIASVFHASLKRAIISGLWTWLIHNLFQVRLVYIPSVLAALLGAIPFMGAYWASLPAVLELYFQDYALYAVLLTLIQILSVQTVDSTVYKEIKGGGHPYLTGLSIAGGMFWLGPEGVIVGPLLLCLLFVAINMSTAILREAESAQDLQEQVKHLSELSQLNQIRRSVL